MHTYACHWCDPSSARFVATSTLQPTQSFTVDSDVVVVARLCLLTARRLTRHRSRETEETPVPYHHWIGWEEVWRAKDSAPLGSSLRDRSASPTAQLRVVVVIPGGKPRRQPAVLTSAATEVHVIAVLVAVT